MMSQPTVRAQTQQQRSRETLEAILTAAGALFDEVGPKATTMDAIAARAGVSIGSVYRFFANRDAIEATIAASWHERIRNLALPLFSPESLARDVSEVVGEFVAGLQRILTELPGARGLLTSTVGQPTSGVFETFTDHLERFIDRYAPGLTPARRRRAARICQTLTIAVMLKAGEPGRADDAALQLNEIRTVLVGYTQQLSAESGQPRRGSRKR